MLELVLVCVGLIAMFIGMAIADSISIIPTIICMAICIVCFAIAWIVEKTKKENGEL